MNCNNCGAEIKRSMVFCTTCGEKIISAMVIKHSSKKVDKSKNSMKRSSIIYLPIISGCLVILSLIVLFFEPTEIHIKNISLTNIDSESNLISSDVGDGFSQMEIIDDNPDLPINQIDSIDDINLTSANNEIVVSLENESSIGLVNIALGKLVTGSAPAHISYTAHTWCLEPLDFDYSIFVDGNSNPVDWSSCDPIPYASLNESGRQWLMVDLGAVFNISKIKLWHYRNYVYHDNIVEISEDGENWTLVYDSNIDGEYTETSEGKRIPLEPKNARYIRNWLNGNNVNNGNHWVEVEVYGTKI